MKHKPKSKGDLLLEEYERQSRIYMDGVVRGGRVAVAMIFALLADNWNFSSDNLQDLLQDINSLFYSFADGNEDPNAWIAGLKEQYGIDLCDTFNRMV